MTRKQREQVVELLRCAADCGGAVTVASFALGSKDAVFDAAWDARQCVVAENRWETHVDVCLEAAQRVEEGSWP